MPHFLGSPSNTMCLGPQESPMQTASQSIPVLYSGWNSSLSLSLTLGRLGPPSDLMFIWPPRVLTTIRPCSVQPCLYSKAAWIDVEQTDPRIISCSRLQLMHLMLLNNSKSSFPVSLDRSHCSIWLWLQCTSILKQQVSYIFPVASQYVIFLTAAKHWHFLMVIMYRARACPELHYYYRQWVLCAIVLDCWQPFKAVYHLVASSWQGLYYSWMLFGAVSSVFLNFVSRYITAQWLLYSRAV